MRLLSTKMEIIEQNTFFSIFIQNSLLITNIEVFASFQIGLNTPDIVTAQKYDSGIVILPLRFITNPLSIHLRR